jgi:hypothetical protein
MRRVAVGDVMALRLAAFGSDLGRSGTGRRAYTIAAGP